jgi:hypothetical protein
MREYRYRVDAEGRVFHDGSEIVDPPTLRFFLLAMTRTPEGRWLAVCQGERNWFEPDETPFVVQRVRPVLRDGAVEGLELVLAGEYREPLDPETLDSARGRLRCRVRRGAFPARFGRSLSSSVCITGEGGAAVVVWAGGAIPSRTRRTPEPRGGRADGLRHPWRSRARQEKRAVAGPAPPPGR